MSEGHDADLGVGVERGELSSTLRNRPFRNLLLASATSSMGDWIGLFALIALAETLAGTSRAGALAVSFVMIARVVPTLFIAPIAGVFVDRWDRKRTMIVTDVVRGGVMAIVPFVGDAFQLIIATFVIEVAAALFIPAKDAVVPTIVPKRQLVHANQLSLSSSYATLPVGALLCAVVIAYTESVAPTGFLQERPEAVPILLNALSFFVSILFILRIDIPDDHVRARAEQAPEERRGALGELRDGLAFIAGMPLIRALVVGIMAAFLAAGTVIGVGEFFATITNAGEAGFAMLGFIVGLGLVVGLVSAAPLSKRIAKERLFAPGIGLAGVALVAAALMPTLLAAAVPVFVMGLGSGVSFVIGYTMLQEYSEDELRGRIFATFNTAVRAALFAALVLGPLTITVLGVERTNAQIAAGAEVELDTLDDGVDEQGRYPYQIGGVRVTLVLAGLIAFGGAAWTGASVRRALRDHAGRGPGLQDLAPSGPPLQRRGVFVVFEGGEGAGKTTQVRLLRAAVERAGYEVVLTREPGGTRLGERVRELLLAPGEVAPRAEALLYSAARAQHTSDVLRPALERGAVVLCDRFVDSSIVYQGVARGLGVDVIAQLNRWATDDLVPDLTILLDVDAEVGLQRARVLDTPDRLEAEGLAFHGRVNEAFRRRAASGTGSYLVLDAAGRAEHLHANIRSAVLDLLAGEGAAVDDVPVTAAADPDAVSGMLDMVGRRGRRSGTAGTDRDEPVPSSSDGDGDTDVVPTAPDAPVDVAGGPATEQGGAPVQESPTDVAPPPPPAAARGGRAELLDEGTAVADAPPSAGERDEPATDPSASTVELTEELPGWLEVPTNGSTPDGAAGQDDRRVDLPTEERRP